METVCQPSYPLNSENSSPFGTRTVYLAWAVSCAEMVLPPKPASTETASETTTITTAGILLLFIPTLLVVYCCQLPQGFERRASVDLLEVDQVGIGARPGHQLEDAGPRAHREAHRTPGASTRGAHDADVSGVESRAGQGRRDHDVDAFGEAQPDLPRSSLEEELGLGRLPGAEIDEDVQALQAPGHGGRDAIERGKRTRRDAQRVSSGRRDAAR